MSFFNTNNPKSHFIIAAPRSGTTWMSKMLNAHPQVFCVERRLFGEYADFVIDEGREQPRLRVTFDKYVNSLLLHYGMSRDAKVQFTKRLVSGFLKEEAKFSGKKIIVDKITPYIDTSHIVLNQIQTYFPKSKLLFLIRDGRDVLTSGVFHWFNKQKADQALSAFEKERRSLFLSGSDTKLERFFLDKEIEQWAKEWSQYLQCVEEAKKHHEVKIIYYEDLLEDTSKVMTEVLKFFNGKAQPAIVEACVQAGSFKKMSDGREKGEAKQNAHVRKGIAGDWKNYFTKKDGELFHKIAGKELIAYGYERNEDWFEQIR